MADIQYLNYGDLQIELLALLNSLANNVLNYVAKQSWSNKRKLKFMSAYSDIMNKGVLGASNSTGQWMLDIGDTVDLDSMDLKDKEMYLEAAYFIQQQMAGLPTKASEEEKKEEDKSKLPVFDNNTFKTGFLTQISNDYFGGNKDIETSAWNEYDKRDDKGIRGRTERAKMLIESLEKYALNLELNKDKYNFEDSPFGSLDEFKNRIANARKALIDTPTDTDDDFKALNALGLNASDWFNNGSGDPSGQYITLSDGTQKELSYAELAKYNLDLAKLKDELEAENIKLRKQAAYNNTLFINRVTNSKLLGLNAQALKEKYKDSNSLLTALQEYSLRDIRTLTPDELSEVLGAYRYLANLPIDNKLLKQLLSSSSGLYRNAAPNRFRKINGIDNLIWDDVAKQIIQINTRQQLLTLLNQPLDLFAEVQTELEKNQQQITNPRGGGILLTDADKRDIYATIADLGAVVDPEVFSGTALALSASGARTWNSIEQRGLWDTLTDWKTWADWGTGALGGTALLGDASSAVKFVRGLGRIMTLPAVGSAILNAPEAKAAWDKIDLKNPIESAKKLTPQDYHALSSFLIGIVSGKNYIKGNLAERAVMQHSGINTQATTKRREWLNKYGITRTKPSSLSKLVETPTLKIKKTGEDGKVEEREIEITRDLLNTLLNTKPSKINEEAKKLLGNKIPEGFEVSRNTNWSKSKIINPAKSLIGKGNSEIFGKPKILITDQTSLDNFENWLNSRSTWNLYKPWSLGTNSNLRKIRNNIFGKDFDESGLISSASGEESQYAKKPLKLGEIKKSDHIERLPDKSSKEEIQIRRDVMNDYRKIIKEGKFSSKNIEGGRESIKIGDEDVRIYSSTHSDGTPTITISTSKGNNNFKSQEEAKKFIASIVKEQKNNIVKGSITKNNIKELGKILQDLKKKGWLKQGGTIDKQRIQQYKEFINK